MLNLSKDITLMCHKLLEIENKHSNKEGLVVLLDMRMELRELIEEFLEKINVYLNKCFAVIRLMEQHLYTLNYVKK